MNVCPMCQGVSVRPEIPGCHGCISCDFTGTREGYEEMQRFMHEAMQEADKVKEEDAEL